MKAPGGDATPDDLELLFVGCDWPRFCEIDELRYATLYGPFGVAREKDFQDGDRASTHLAALVDGRLVGYGRLIMHADGTAQIRQIAVDPAHRRRGIGTALVKALGERAQELGAGDVWLDARLFAMKLYRKLGYEPTGDIFKSPLTGILHQRMVLGDGPRSAA